MTASRPEGERTFDNFCTAFQVTPRERIALVWHLALYRFRRTLTELLP